jgi:hypothetical protein
MFHLEGALASIVPVVLYAPSSSGMREGLGLRTQ